MQNKIIKEENYAGSRLPSERYEDCEFINCIFSESDLSNIEFVDCEFVDCDWSNAQLYHTGLKTVRFRNCKLLGLAFQDANDFLLSLAFEDCTLNLASFFQMKLKGIHFKNCELQEVDFTETDLTSAYFENCDLNQAIFDRTKLEKANLLTAFNYQIRPENNRIKKAKFSKSELLGLLKHHNIIVQ